MKKILLLAIGVATLGLGACNRHTCPAYSSVKSHTTTLSASTAVPAARL